MCVVLYAACEKRPTWVNNLINLIQSFLGLPRFIVSATFTWLSMTDHRPSPASHSTGATVSSSPHQHHPSTSSSSMSTDPTLTDTNSSLETASNAAAAATTAGPVGCCRWLSSTPPPGPGSGPGCCYRPRLGLTPWSHPRPPAQHWLLVPLAVFATSPCLSLVV